MGTSRTKPFIVPSLPTKAATHETIIDKTMDSKNWARKIFNKEINSVKNQKVLQIFSLDPKK